MVPEGNVIPFPYPGGSPAGGADLDAAMAGFTAAMNRHLARPTAETEAAAIRAHKFMAQAHYPDDPAEARRCHERAARRIRSRIGSLIPLDPEFERIAIDCGLQAEADVARFARAQARRARR
jgi:hypothetical protein